MVEGWVIQAIGVAGMGTHLISLSVLSDRTMKVVQAWGSLLWITHFALLGAWAGMAMNVLQVVNLLVALQFPHRGVARVLVCLPLMLAPWVVGDVVDVFPLIGQTGMAYAVLFMAGADLRLMLLIGASGWMIHNVHYESWAGVASGAMFMTMNGVAAWRLLRLGHAVDAGELSRRK